MNPNGPSQRLSVARYDDDYPLLYGEPARQPSAGDAGPAQANAGEPDVPEQRHGQPQQVIQVDLLDAWLQP